MKKTKTYRCGWKEDNQGYTLEEAQVIKCKLDIRNGVYDDRQKCNEAEIIDDSRGGFMVRVEL